MIRCGAITASGRRCSRSGARWTFPVTFAWDPIAGVGEDGPNLCLCDQHGMKAICLKDEQRMRVVDGWYGHAFNTDAKVWTVVGTVLARRSGIRMSKKWLRFRMPTRFGVCRDRETYDTARRAA